MAFEEQQVQNEQLEQVCLSNNEVMIEPLRFYD